MTASVRIDPNGLYNDTALRRELGLRQTAIDRARRKGELRCTRKGGRNLYLGRWVESWLINEPAEAALAST